MSRTEQGLAEVTVEQRLLQEVCELVRSCDGQPPVAALDAVLSGRRRPVVSCAPRPVRRPRSTGHRRPGAGVLPCPPRPR